ncbi:NUDIX hydrolase [Kocuria sp. JC486]|uniref:NUDIX hydrolase n=1 Tax=Kocuria soli TaxID=2485125 RepID=A0A3N4A4B1_9MICC|nr:MULTISPECIES: NUDIX hydrolase [Kocuria]NHU84720.1 NUDIX hydrolase [Kocuria sp. JC486]ROZ63459.1 NUDIX hydrolase [Kocuria soli]
MPTSAYRTSAHGPDSVPEVRAAGCLCWRPGAGGIELLVIHRPRYDDWSWPKGKLDDDETLPEAAHREVREEVNLDVRLGVPLPTTEYQVKAGRKHVYYWSAEVPPYVEPRPDGKEVDQLRWVSPEEAARLLTNETDRIPLRRLVELHQAGDLAVRPVIVVRHAKAKPRSSWSRAEGDRPLAATGKRQALAVTQLLKVWSPQRVISSPWLRCLSTVTPYAKTAGLKVKERPALTEAAHKRSPKKASAVVETLFDKDKPVALCTHRPVLPTALGVLRGHLPSNLRKMLPTEDPYLVPGEMLVLQVSRRHRQRAVSLEIVKPFES